MAISRGAGTEIIRTALFEDAYLSSDKLIVGIQYHIYTILSMTFYCTVRAGTEVGFLAVNGYDSTGGDTNSLHYLTQTNCAAGQTFVWNDKFSFNGFEPVSFTGPLSTAAEQDAIADQGSGVSQFLMFYTSSVNTKYDITLTYIDQNNA